MVGGNLFVERIVDLVCKIVIEVDFVEVRAVVRIVEVIFDNSKLLGCCDYFIDLQYVF